MKKLDELTDSNSCLSRAANDEWIFVLLGRDIAAPSTIRFWINERVRLGKNQHDDPQIVEAMQLADKIEGAQMMAARDRAAGDHLPPIS